MPEETISARSYYPEKGFYRAKPALGGHELIVTKNHDHCLDAMPRNVLEEMLLAIQRRYIFYAKNDLVEYAMAIYNHGPQAGASIEHGHAQLFASSIVPNLITTEKHSAEKYYELNNVCPFCDMVEHEKKEKIRMLCETDDFVMFNFFASRYPFEIWILPKKHTSNFETASGSIIKDLSKIMRRGLDMLAETLNDPPLNFYIHSLPTTSENADYYHWHLEIAPRVTGYGGYEMGSGVIIDIASPEDCAKYLRKSLKEK